MSTNDQHSLLQTIKPIIRALGADLTPKSKIVCGPYDISGIAKPGDHIAMCTMERGNVDVIWHHGIYMGDSRVVFTCTIKMSPMSARRHGCNCRVRMRQPSAQGVDHAHRVMGHKQCRDFV
jgi:hypothetical protein